MEKQIENLSKLNIKNKLDKQILYHILNFLPFNIEFNLVTASLSLRERIFKNEKFLEILKLLINLGSDGLKNTNINKTRNYINLINQVSIIELIYNKFKDNITLEAISRPLIYYYNRAIETNKKYYYLNLVIDKKYTFNQSLMSLEFLVMNSLNNVIFIIEEVDMENIEIYTSYLKYIKFLEISVKNLKISETEKLFDIIKNINNTNNYPVKFRSLELSNSQLESVSEYFKQYPNSLNKLEMITTREERLKSLINHEIIAEIINNNINSLKTFPKNIYQTLLTDYKFYLNKTDKLLFKNIEVYINHKDGSNSDLNTDYNFEINTGVFYIDNRELIKKLKLNEEIITKILHRTKALNRVEENNSTIEEEISIINKCKNLHRLGFSFTNTKSAEKLILFSDINIINKIHTFTLYFYDKMIDQEKEAYIFDLLLENFKNLRKFEYRCSYHPKLVPKYFNFEISNLFKYNSASNQLPLKLIVNILHNNKDLKALLQVRYNDIQMYNYFIEYLKDKEIQIHNKIQILSHEDQNNIYDKEKDLNIHNDRLYSILDFRTNDTNFNIFTKYLRKIREINIYKNSINEEFTNMVTQCKIRIINIEKDPFGNFLKYLLNNIEMFPHLIWLQIRNYKYKTDELINNKIVNLNSLDSLLYLKLNVDNNYAKLMEIFDNNSFIKIKKDSTFNFGIIYIV